MKYSKVEKINILRQAEGLELQVKSTTKDGINESKEIIKYPLKVKNYNDLIDRKRNFSTTLLLVLFILPTDIKKWVEMNQEELMIRKCAYWFFPENETESTGNESTKTITINKRNLLSIDNFNQLFEKYS